MQQHVRQLPAPAEGEQAGRVGCCSSCGGNSAEPASSRQAPHPHTASGSLAQEPGPALASPSLPHLHALPPPDPLSQRRLPFIVFGGDRLCLLARDLL